MRKIQNITFGVLFISAFIGCSTKKDAFINRNWHALNTKYNVLYNGHVAFEKGKETIETSYTDNFWETLPIEQMEIKETITLSDSPENPNFERAEEKATKAIQKHGMHISNRERNPQTDEAYLLLGKSRYYDQRFVPALEAFNYVLYKYPDSDKIGEASVWREKVNIRLENNELAIKNLKRLLKQERLQDQTYADATAVMAQAYINLKYLDSAAQELKIAAAYTRKNKEKGRYYYILGQLYNELGHKDTANMAFDKVINLNRKAPRAYMINAYIEKIKNFDSETGDKELLYETLTDLEKNRENRPFLDKIYRQVALFHLENDSIDLAKNYFNKSLQESTPDEFLKALNYEDLATIYFDVASYKEAGAYYDSTLTNLKEKTKKHRTISRKRKNLEDVIKYEAIVQKNDSILYILSLSEEGQTAYYEKYIADIKAKEIAEAEKLATEKQQTGIANTFNNKTSNNTTRENFYFYNTIAVGYGKNEFRKTWGNRKLEDNWRLSNRTTTTNIGTPQNTITANTEVEDIYDVNAYLDKLPKAQQEIDSIKKERDFSYYQLGLIYKEKFKEYELASKKLETLLKNQPEEKLILPSKYNLYKIYEVTENETKAFAIKQDIITNHSASRYAEILQNPQAVLSTDENSPDARYTNLYKLYEAQKYEEVISLAEQYIRIYTGDAEASRFELLKANAVGRLEGLEAYDEALNYVALNYPNDEFGKAAQKIIDESITKLKNNQFNDADPQEKWKLIFPFNKQDTTTISKLQKTIEKALSDLKYNELFISKDVYDRAETFIVVHGFRTKERALGFAELLKINKEYKINEQNFVISTSNYKTLQIHKNKKEYLETK
ncbi:hypothetical protein [Leptobacterium sp. I13]|uniref:type IX secretion system periplasmic lipoprotein PorW/SprE n=1 Tax=Leptobacterium meishanense TaxID=3128904 RepID=UPI0030EE24F7